MILRQAQDDRGELVEPLSFNVHCRNDTGIVAFTRNETNTLIFHVIAKFGGTYEGTVR